MAAAPTVTIGSHSYRKRRGARERRQTEQHRTSKLAAFRLSHGCDIAFVKAVEAHGIIAEHFPFEIVA
jgi:hypothetical protein